MSSHSPVTLASIRMLVDTLLDGHYRGDERKTREYLELIASDGLSGTLTVPVTVNDGTDDSGVFNLSVTVTPVNDAPVTMPLPDQTIAAGGTSRGARALVGSAAEAAATPPPARIFSRVVLPEPDLPTIAT